MVHKDSKTTVFNIVFFLNYYKQFPKLVKANQADVIISSSQDPLEKSGLDTHAEFWSHQNMRLGKLCARKEGQQSAFYVRLCPKGFMSLCKCSPAYNGDIPINPLDYPK